MAPPPLRLLATTRTRPDSRAHASHVWWWRHRGFNFKIWSISLLFISSLHVPWLCYYPLTDVSHLLLAWGGVKPNKDSKLSSYKIQSDLTDVILWHVLMSHMVVMVSEWSSPRISGYKVKSWRTVSQESGMSVKWFTSRPWTTSLHFPCILIPRLYICMRVCIQNMIMLQM